MYNDGMMLSNKNIYLVREKTDTRGSNITLLAVGVSTLQGKEIEGKG